MSAIDVRGLSKNYPLSHSRTENLRRLFAPSREKIHGGLWALRDVSFAVECGEAFGIVGANGSGKSTLLRIIAGILQPTSGSFEVNGRLSALLELGSGFSPEFTGRENVYLNGSILGLSREQIDARLEAIERFAEIGEFIDQPIKTYSTGMAVRVAFAVAAHADPEILIVDEALAVGDIAFRQRCMRRIHELRAHGVTILFVSHEASDVKALCERCLWLEHGAVRMLGEADEVIAGYMSASLRAEIERASHEDTHRAQLRPRTTLEKPMRFERGHRYGDGRAVIIAAALTRADDAAALTADPGERVFLHVCFHGKADISSPVAGFLVRNAKGENIFGSNTARENYPLPGTAAGETHKVDFQWAMPDLAPGSYRVSIAISDGSIEDFQVCDYVEDAIEFQVSPGAKNMRGYLRLRCTGVEIHRNG